MGDQVKKQAKFQASIGGYVIFSAVTAWATSPLIPYANEMALGSFGALLGVSLFAKYEKDVRNDVHPLVVWFSRWGVVLSYLGLVGVFVLASISSYQRSYPCDELQSQMLDKSTGSAEVAKKREAAHDNFSALGCHYQGHFLRDGYEWLHS